jgi:hypothetical protein
VVIVGERICQSLIVMSLQTVAGYHRTCLFTTYMTTFPPDRDSKFHLMSSIVETLGKCTGSYGQRYRDLFDNRT